MRPQDETRWLIIDLDIHSPYHPQQNPDWLSQIRNSLEDIGLCRWIVNQSSHSGGLHLYLPLPAPVSSFWASITLKYALESIGIRLKSGHCELYPNPKRYIPQGQGYSNFAAIRLPMQPESGFHPLDDDLNPLPWTLDHWLSQFETRAQQQDFPRFTQAIAEAKANFKVRSYRHPQSLANWESAIALEKDQGWTGPGQTNEKLKRFGCEARVFMGLDSIESIAAHIQTTAQNSPGFYEYSNHIQDLERRSREVAAWAIKYYWPIGTPPNRQTSYHSSESDPETNKIIQLSYHQHRQEAAQNRIQQAVAQLLETNALPASTTERANAIIAQANVGRKTLYRKTNLPLWHPDHLVSDSPSTPPASPPPEPALAPPVKTPDPLPPLENSQPSLNSTKTSLVRSLNPLIYLINSLVFIYVGFVDLSTSMGSSDAALAPPGQRAAIAAVPSDFSDPLPTPEDWAALRRSLPPELRRKIDQAERWPKAGFRPLRFFAPSSPSGSQQLELGIGGASADVLVPDGWRGRSPLDLDEFLEPEPLTHREPFAMEQQDFEAWYALAVAFGLVSDWVWQMREYLVLSQGQWVPYVELSAVFTLQRLSRYLGDPEPEEVKSDVKKS
jgi:hypothetical protein